MNKNWRKILKNIITLGGEDPFNHLIEYLEVFVAKILSIALIAVILVSIFDLVLVLSKDLLSEPVGFFNKTLIEIFGFFLNILIALELLENITGYLKKHVFQVELVIATSLIAVARKVIVFDFNKLGYPDLAALGFASLCLAIGYWLVRRTVKGD